jgi:SAM-dependent methyltransferase
MKAEHLDFPDESFDFVWSWGVIHHSSNTGTILREIRRVLRPGGSAVCMVYNRSLWGYYVVGGLIHGVLMGDLLKTRSLHRTVQRTTDGAMARFYTGPEWRQLARVEGLRVVSVRVYGDKSELVPLPGGRLKTRVMRMLPDGVARLFLHRLRQGSFLVSHVCRAERGVATVCSGQPAEQAVAHPQVCWLREPCVSGTISGPKAWAISIPRDTVRRG